MNFNEWFLKLNRFVCNQRSVRFSRSIGRKCELGGNPPGGEVKRRKLSPGTLDRSIAEFLQLSMQVQALSQIQLARINSFTRQVQLKPLMIPLSASNLVIHDSRLRFSLLKCMRVLGWILQVHACMSSIVLRDSSPPAELNCIVAPLSSPRQRTSATEVRFGNTIDDLLRQCISGAPIASHRRSEGALALNHVIDGKPPIDRKRTTPAGRSGDEGRRSVSSQNIHSWPRPKGQ